MSNQIVISSGAKVRNLSGVLTGTSGIVNSLGINVPDGIPQLDGSGKILVSQLPNSVMEYKGTWNAATNTPTLANGTGNAGDVYLCNVAGTTNFGAGPITFAVGDQVLYSGTTWEKASGATGTVTSVAVTESGDALTITGSPITTSGTINIGFAGTSGQYINGAGGLTTFPDLTGYVTLSTAQTITGSKTFTTSNIFSGSNLFTTFSQRFNQGIAISESANFGSTLDYTTIVGAVDGLALRLSSDGKKIFAFEDGATDNTYTFPDASGTIALTSDLSSYVPYTGATGNVNLGEYGLSGGYLGFDITPTGTPTTQGTMSWNADKESLDLIMNGVTGSIMQDAFYNVKNQTGASIPKGTIVMAVGTLGASGRILIAPFLADGTYDSKFCIGVTAETIADGDNGKVTAFGSIRQIDTSAYADGTILYASPSVAGGFTSTEPTTPNNIVTVAIVINSHASTGTIFVRPTFIPSAVDLQKALGYTPANDSLVVPYTGATTNVNIGNNLFSSANIRVDGDNTSNFGYLGFKQFSGGSNGFNGYTSIFAQSTNYLGFSYSQGAGSAKTALFASDLISINTTRTYNLPNTNGTLALTSDLSNYVTLGTTQTITGDKTYSGVNIYNDYQTRFSMGIAINNTTSGGAVGSHTVIGANVNGLQINLAGGGYNNLNFASTSAGNTYTLPNATGTIALTSDLGSYLPLSGGTLTGALSGTSATFSGQVTSDDLILTAGTLFSTGVTGFSNRASDTTLYLQMPATGFNITDNALNTKFIFSSSGAATFSSSVTAGKITTSGTAGLPSSSALSEAIVLIQDSGSNRRLGLGSSTSGQWIQSSYPGADGIASTLLINPSGGKLLVGTSTAGYGLFTEQRMTLNPTNDGITVAPLPQNNSAYTVQANNDTGNRYALYIANGSSSGVGNISFTSSSTSYNTSSDYRLKQDLKEFNGLSILSKVKTYDFEWKIDNSRMYGVIAHELQDVIPYAVLGEKDGEQMQSVDYSKIVPILVKAIQELNEKIKQLENK